MIEEICLNCQFWDRILHECTNCPIASQYHDQNVIIKKDKRLIFYYASDDYDTNLEIAFITDPTFSCSKFEERKEVKSNG